MKTKIVGWLIVLMSVVKIAIDALDGGSFNISMHWEELTTALAGAGLVFLRSGVSKAAKGQS